MAFTWSKEQKQAIYESGKSILVNAGAGSGKTAVLTERLLEKVKSGVPLSKLVVLTFTKLAASEMKERLRKSLLVAPKDKNILNAIDYIDQANIQTFDAFASEIVQKYHYLLGVSKHNTIGDAASLEFQRKRIIGEIFEEMYEIEEPNFLKLIDNYTVKKDDGIREQILKLYDKLIVEADYQSILNNYQQYTDSLVIESYIEDYQELIKKKISRIYCYLEVLKKIASAEDTFIMDYNSVEKFMNNCIDCNTYDEMLYVRNATFPRCNIVSEDEMKKETYKLVRDVIKNSLKTEVVCLLTYPSREYIRKLLFDTVDSQMVIVNILRQLDERYKQYKIQNNVFEFNDIANMAIKIFSENEDIRNYYRDNIDEILIDEYQDTSDIQERLISLISNNNVYMVGDVKQSIYRFRNANPDIFKNKCEALKNDGNGLVINLLRNFRSRVEVLSAVNVIFNELMTLNVGGVYYDDTQNLCYGLTDYENNIQRDYRMKILNYNDTDELLASKKYTRAEVEAFIIAKNILEKVGKVIVYDKDIKDFRRSKFSDFCILTHSKDKFELYKRIFEYFNIPLNIHKDLDLNNNDEVYTIYNVLRLVYYINDFKNSREIIKGALTSVLRSFLVNCDDVLISRIITDENVYDSFKSNCPELYKKIIRISNSLDVSTPSQLMSMIYEEFDVFNYLYLVDDVAKSEYIFHVLYQTIENLEDSGYGVADIINYFKEILSDKDKKISYSSNQSTSADAVNMMSIHASKGLEFPICYFPEQYKSFNFQEIKDTFIYSKKYKIILPFIRDKLLDVNCLKSIEINEYRNEEISEKIRLFYVALTRAREEIIIVTPRWSNGINRIMNIATDEAKVKCKSFYDLLDLVPYDRIAHYTDIIDIANLNLSKDYLAHIKLDFVGCDSKELKFVDVELKKKLINQGKASKSSTSLITADQQKLLDEGIYFHNLLELIDFKKDIESQLSCLDNSERYKIEKFFENPFFKSLNIIETYHEYEFIYSKDDREIHGIIDLIIETDDKLIVIDYKLSNIEDNLYIKQVEIYMEYFQSNSSKTVEGYLYSINKNLFKKVGE